MNNAALERLASVTDRVQARRCHRRWKKRQPKKKRIAGRLHSSDAAKRSGRHAEGAEKSVEHEKTPELAAKLAAEAIERTRGRHR